MSAAGHKRTHAPQQSTRPRGRSIRNFNLMDFRSLGLFYNFECFLIFKFYGLVLGISRERLV
jgi:hypothetical protein